MGRRFTGHRLICGGLFVLLFTAYNGNGREIGSMDSQPAKFAARALALRGNLRLDDDIRRLPELAARPSFVLDRGGHYRSAYSPVGPMFGAVTGVALRAVSVDLNAPRGPNLIAALTASTVTALAVCVVFLALVRIGSTAQAVTVAAGLGLGTNLWALHSQTLAQHDVVLLGLSIWLFNWMRPTADLASRHLWGGAVGLALAVTARPQVGPLVAMLGLGLIARVGVRRAAGPLTLAVATLVLLLLAQWRWFGHPLGAMPFLELLHPEIHSVGGSLGSAPWIGASGLLVSPSRGLFIFSPIVLVALAGVPRALRDLRGYGLDWAFGGCLLLFVGYASYSVWWGGHSYGPRYLLDGLVVLTPPAVVALRRLSASRPARVVMTLALAWSVTIAGTGAFFTDVWNTKPDNVDQNHARLWDWSDPQFVRAWQSGLSQQNFNLFNWTSVRAAPRGQPQDR